MHIFAHGGDTDVLPAGSVARCVVLMVSRACACIACCAKTVAAVGAPRCHHSMPQAGVARQRVMQVLTLTCRCSSAAAVARRHRLTHRAVRGNMRASRAGGRPQRVPHTLQRSHDWRWCMHATLAFFMPCCPATLHAPHTRRHSTPACSAWRIALRCVAVRSGVSRIALRYAEVIMHSVA